MSPEDAAPRADDLREAAPPVDTLRVARHARIARLGAPGPHVRRVWIALHGYGQLAPWFVRRLAPLAAPDALVLAPEALNRFYLAPPEERAAGGSQRVGAAWMTREAREDDIVDTLDYLDAALDAARAACAPDAVVGVLGFSQGGTMAARWLSRRRHRPDPLVLWACELPKDEAWMAGLAGLDVRYVVGDADPYVGTGAVAGFAGRLREAGLDWRLVRYAGDHRIMADALREAVSPRA